MNLSTIARLAEVSVSTVSKAFAGSEEISEETRERIYEIARKNGCYDKYMKNKYRKKVIAVIYSEARSDFYAALLMFLDSIITAKGGIMISAATNFSGEMEQELFTYFSAYGRVDGIIIIGLKTQLNNSINIPLVALFSSVKFPNMDTIKGNVQPSFDAAIACMKAHGHTKIGFAGEALTMGRLTLFQTAMEKSGLTIRPQDIKISTSRFEQAGVEMMEEWLAEEDPPTAIFAGYDYIAIGLTKTIRKRGLRVPEDFSIVGVDDISVVPYMDTSISSIRTFSEEACTIAVDLIMKKIENQYYTSGQEIVIETEFVKRESIGPCLRKSVSDVAGTTKETSNAGMDF